MHDPRNYEKGETVTVKDSYEATFEAYDDETNVVVVTVAVGPASPAGIREVLPRDVKPGAATNEGP